MHNFGVMPLNEVLDGDHTVQESPARNVPFAEREAFAASGAERTGVRLPVLGIVERRFGCMKGCPRLPWRAGLEKRLLSSCAGVVSVLGFVTKGASTVVKLSRTGA
jgi:hypothetical protein